MCQELFDAGNNILLCVHVYACVDVYSTSITAMVHCPYV